MIRNSDTSEDTSEHEMVTEDDDELEEDKDKENELNIEPYNGYIVCDDLQRKCTTLQDDLLRDVFQQEIWWKCTETDQKEYLELLCVYLLLHCLLVPCDAYHVGWFDRRFVRRDCVYF